MAAQTTSTENSTAITEENTMKSTITRSGDGTKRRAFKELMTVWTGLSTRRSSTPSEEETSRLSTRMIWRRGWL